MKKLLIYLFIFISIISFADEPKIKDYMDLGKFYFLEEDYENAETVYKEALLIEENNEIVIEKLAQIYEKKGDSKKAIFFYEKLVEMELATKETYFSLGDLYEKKDKDKMYEYYELYLEKDEYKDSEFIFTLGERYFKENLYEKAMNIFKKDKNEDYRNIFGLALTARFLGSYKKSISYYKKLLDKKPGFAEAYLGIGICYRQNGDFRNAASYFEDYLEIKKDHEIYVALTELYLLMNRYEQVKTTAKKGLKEFSNSKELKEILLEIYGT